MWNMEVDDLRGGVGCVKPASNCNVCAWWWCGRKLYEVVMRGKYMRRGGRGGNYGQDVWVRSSIEASSIQRGALKRPDVKEKMRRHYKVLPWLNQRMTKRRPQRYDDLDEDGWMVNEVMSDKTCETWSEIFLDCNQCKFESSDENIIQWHTWKGWVMPSETEETWYEGALESDRRSDTVGFHILLFQCSEDLTLVYLRFQLFWIVMTVSPWVMTFFCCS